MNHVYINGFLKNPFFPTFLGVKSAKFIERYPTLHDNSSETAVFWPEPVTLLSCKKVSKRVHVIHIQKIQFNVREMTSGTFENLSSVQLVISLPLN